MRLGITIFPLGLLSYRLTLLQVALLGGWHLSFIPVLMCPRHLVVQSMPFLVLTSESVSSQGCLSCGSLFLCGGSSRVRFSTLKGSLTEENLLLASYILSWSLRKQL